MFILIKKTQLKYTKNPKTSKKKIQQNCLPHVLTVLYIDQYQQQYLLYLLVFEAFRHEQH